MVLIAKEREAFSYQSRADSLTLAVRQDSHGSKPHDGESTVYRFDCHRAEQDMPDDGTVVNRDEREHIWTGLAKSIDNIYFNMSTESTCGENSNGFTISWLLLSLGDMSKYP